MSISSNISHQLYTNISHQLCSNISHQLYSNISHQLYSSISHQLCSNISHQLCNNISHQLYSQHLQNVISRLASAIALWASNFIIEEGLIVITSGNLNEPDLVSAYPSSSRCSVKRPAVLPRPGCSGAIDAASVCQSLARTRKDLDIYVKFSEAVVKT